MCVCLCVCVAGTEVTFWYRGAIYDEAADTSMVESTADSGSISCSGSSCEFLGGGGIRTERLRLDRLIRKVIPQRGVEIAEHLAISPAIKKK